MDTLTTDTITFILGYLSFRDVAQLVYTNKAISQSIIAVETSYYDRIRTQFGSDAFYRAAQNTWLHTYSKLARDPHCGRQIPIFQIQDEVDYDTSQYHWDHTKSYVAFFPNEIVLTITTVETDSVWKTCEIYSLAEYLAESQYDASYERDGFDRFGRKQPKETKKYQTGLDKYRTRFMASAISNAYYEHNFMLISPELVKVIFRCLRYRYIDLDYRSNEDAIVPVLYHGAITDLMSQSEMHDELQKEVSRYSVVPGIRRRYDLNLNRYAQILPYITS